MSQPTLPDSYGNIHSAIVHLLEDARRAAARSVNALMTASYWEIGRRIVEAEQGGQERAEYGKALLKRLSTDLTTRFGRGFSERNLEQMRGFYLCWPPERISQTASAKLGEKDVGESISINLPVLAKIFPLPWSSYVRLLSVKNEQARAFYETEALRGGWSVRQLDRQINSQFFERTALSRNKVAMLEKGEKALPGDAMTPEETIKDPFVLEFLGLKDEYSEAELEEALIHRLEDFLLELGDDFAFVGRQRRLRVGDSWFRIDLLFFHRCLKCLVIIDLKAGRFSYADVGQMHLYLNYAKAHWMREGENPPIGLILCASKDTAEAHYALDGLPNTILAAEYKTVLPSEKQIEEALQRARLDLENKRLMTKQKESE
jgi:predicted nuclease of restriction endonuclease-like (RecB) superfamily